MHVLIGVDGKLVSIRIGCLGGAPDVDRPDLDRVLMRNHLPDFGGQVPAHAEMVLQKGVHGVAASQRGEGNRDEWPQIAFVVEFALHAGVQPHQDQHVSTRLNEKLALRKVLGPQAEGFGGATAADEDDVLSFDTPGAAAVVLLVPQLFGCCPAPPPW